MRLAARTPLPLSSYAVPALTGLAVHLLLLLVPGAAQARPATGGASYEGVPPTVADPAATPGGQDAPLVPGNRATLLLDGRAAAPVGAPEPVRRAIWAANDLRSKPYRYGGGHGSFRDSGYDCSGTVSYALHAADLVSSPLDSSSFMGWGERGPGAWITVYTNPGHAYVVLAGLRLDTSAYNVRSAAVASAVRLTPAALRRASASGPRWRPTSRPSGGFRIRHPAGL